MEHSHTCTVCTHITCTQALHTHIRSEHVGSRREPGSLWPLPSPSAGLLSPVGIVRLWRPGTLWPLRLQCREVSQQRPRLPVLGDPGLEQASGRLSNTQA